MTELESDIWWSVVFGICFFFIGAISLGLAIVGGSLQGSMAAVVVILLGILTPALSYYLPSRDRRRKQRILARRQAALAGDTGVVPLADTQPVPDIEALSLPFTIKTRPNWLSITLAFGLLALVFGGVWWATLLNPVPPDAPKLLLVQTIFATLLFGLFLFTATRASCQQLEITADSLMRTGPDFQRMPWNQIKLFAIAPGSSRKTPPKGYELASASYSFPLRRLRRRDLLRLSTPTASFDEYDRQMEALLSVIAAKTGLPLYDLR